MIAKREAKKLPYILTLLDLGMLLIAFTVALYIRFSTNLIPIWVPAPDMEQYLYLMFGVLPIWWFNLLYFRVYSSQYILHGAEEYQRIVNAATAATLHIMVLIYLLKVDYARGWVLLAWVTSVVMLLAGRLMHRRLHRVLSKKWGTGLRTILIGVNSEAKTMLSRIKKHSWSGMEVIGSLSDNKKYEDFGLTNLGNVDNAADVIQKNNIDTVIIFPSALSANTLQGLYHQCSQAGASVYVSPSLHDIVASRVAVLPFSDLPLVRIQEVEFSGVKYAIKRVGDILFSLFGITLLMPIFVLLYIYIRVESPGSPIFSQERVGRHGKKFTMYKFRTMIKDAHEKIKDFDHLNEADGPIFKIKNDPRITDFGRWLRCYSIDELPQLFNVLGGSMSLVGPRPALPTEVEKYSDLDQRRLEVNPGMTGLWQVSGRSDTTFSEMIRLDLYYIENWSPSFDFYLLLRTIDVVRSGKGAC